MCVHTHTHIHTTLTSRNSYRRRKTFLRKDLRVINHLGIVSDVYMILSKRVQHF